MTKTFISSLVGLVSVLLIGFAAIPALAQDGYTPWRTMHAGANAPTMAAAMQQCRNSGIPAGECAEFSRMLTAGTCQSVTVPDGTLYRWLGGRDAKISHRLTKQLGEPTAALRCVLPSGRTLDWYAKNVTGDGACNNVGEVAKAAASIIFHPGSVTVREQHVVTTPGLVIDPYCPYGHGRTIYLPGTQAVTTFERSGQSAPIQLK